MELRVRYDAGQDRMLLFLRPDGADAVTLSVPRRQWILWATSVRSLCEGLPEQAGRPKNGPKAPAVPLAEPDEPRLVSAIRMRRQKGGVRFIFVSDKGNDLIAVPNDGLRRLQSMLVTQADRAGWDVGAAMDRIAARIAEKKTQTMH